MIKIIDFSNVEINGDNVGDCFSVIANYPGQAGAILAALNVYEQGLIAAAVPAHEMPMIGPGEIAELQQQIADRDATIEAQIQQLSRLLITDWDGLIDALKAAGFSRWLADAGDANPDLLDEVARLYAAAKVGDRIGVITEYLTISSQYVPSIEQLQGWQAVLDNYQPHPIPPNLLWFIAPGASTSP